MKDATPSKRNKVKRVPKRGHYDEETIYQVLDSAFIAHVGFVVDGQPFVIPTAYGREGNQLYFHGSTKSRLMLQMEQEIPICLTVTQLDGIVLARSSFHHSMNYRSAVVFGKARKLEGEEKERALYVISEQILPGRWE
ncbi:MAG: pyridoxamine 5'-phosphate oxidase family protein, partial [Bacteroidota bacterium]